MTTKTEIDMTSIFAASSYSTFRMVAIAFCGGLYVKFNLIDRKIMKGVAEICANLLIPSLIISEILKSFKISDYELWLPILIYCLVCVFVGFVVSVIAAKLFCFEEEMFRLILICNMFSNSTSMQLVYVDCLSPIFAKYLNISVESAKSSGNLAVLLYTVFVNFLRWSIGFYIMKPSQVKVVQHEYTNKLDNSEGGETNKIRYDEHSRDMIQIQTSSDLENRSKPSQSKGIFLKICKEIMNIPLISGVISIILTVIPKLNELFTNKDGIFSKTFLDSFDAMGKCSSTFVIFLLGLNIAISILESNNEETISKKVLGIILLTKLAFIPCLGYLFVYFIGYRLNWINDPIYSFFIVSNFFTPTAVNMITMSVIRKFQISNLSKVLVYSYLIGCVTMTGWTIFFLRLFLN